MTRLLLATAAALIAVSAARAQIQQVRPQNAVKGRAEPAVGDPVPFVTRDGARKGWKVVLPGERPLATPAVADGKVFLGGGFGSHDFYAFDARTGQKLWQYRTRDDGPTAAVVADGHVIFNTESCELEVLTLDGKPVRKKWLGDPLMSMPAAADGKVYMAYPEPKGGQHHLACFDLKSGRELWKRPIAGEIITAPVVDRGQVYLATLDGTLYSFRATGEPEWTDRKNATCAPVPLDDRCVFSCRDDTPQTKDGRNVSQRNEALAFKFARPAGEVKTIEATRLNADYLDYAKRSRSVVENRYQTQDKDVGFPGANKGDAKIGQAKDNLGQNSVAGVWSYQGSRPAVAAGRVFTAMGDTVKCVDAASERVLWRRPVQAPRDKGELLDAALTPPAVVNGKVFLGTARGELLCLSARTGDRLWSAQLGEPIAFQPAVAAGRAYVVTTKGSLICMETGDDKDDGWLMWGGNAAHNGAALSPN